MIHIAKIAFTGDIYAGAEALSKVFPVLPNINESWHKNDVIEAWVSERWAKAWIEDYEDNGCWLLPLADKSADGAIEFVTPSKRQRIRCFSKGLPAVFELDFAAGSVYAAGQILTNVGGNPRLALTELITKETAQ